MKLTNANDQYADVTVTVDLLPGDRIPDVLFAAARTAAERAYDRKVPKLRPVVLDQHGNARPRPPRARCRACEVGSDP